MKTKLEQIREALRVHDNSYTSAIFSEEAHAVSSRFVARVRRIVAKPLRARRSKP